LNKSPDAFRTISEVAEDLDLPQHVLRFWETRFTQIKPMKRGGGRRYYRPDDVDLLKGIRQLLYDEGYTIRGVQRILKAQGNRYVIGIGSGEIDIGDPATPLSEFAAEGSSADKSAITTTAPESAKKAILVKDLGEGGKSGAASGRSLLGRLRGNDAADEISASGLALNEDDRRNLQSTLYELLECKRLLDQVRSN